MRTITQLQRDLSIEVDRARSKAYDFGRAQFDEARQYACDANLDAQKQAMHAITTALAEVPDALEQRIAMWQTVIARSTDDDEIRDAQAAASELRWLLLQLKPVEVTS